MSDSEIRNPKSEMGKRSRRMVVWMVAVPIAILLLALAAANWKRFHLAYARHLIASDDLERQRDGVKMVLDTHVREGMTREEVGRLLAPAKLTEAPRRPASLVMFDVYAGEGRPENYVGTLFFDKNDRLIDPPRQ